MTSELCQLHPGVRVIATDAYGALHPGVVTYGPARDRNGIRGQFLKVWIKFEGIDENVPWPVESVEVAP